MVERKIGGGIIRTPYSQYNCLKFNILKILKDRKWKTIKEIYQCLELEPKPKYESFKRHLRRLYSRGYYVTKLYRENRKWIEKKKYFKRAYLNRKESNGKVYYRLSVSGFHILERMQIEGLKLKRRWREM